YVPCDEVMPGADSYSPRKGRPPYVEAYRTEDGERKVIGYVFLSTDIVDIPGYSGQPMVTLIGMVTTGHITGTQILRHAEPILLLGIPEADLMTFIDQYLGKYVGDRIEIGKSRPEEGLIGLDAISGATVTVIAENQTILRSAMAIAKQVGIVKPVLRPKAQFTEAAGDADWETLVQDGSIRRLTVRTQDVDQPRNPMPYIDMYFGYL